MMNKKTLFLILANSILLFPFVISAAVPEMVDKVKTAFTTVGASIIVIGWVIAGILWLVAAGSPEKIGTAKKATFAAVIGTAVIILAGFAERTIEDLLGLGAG